MYLGKEKKRKVLQKSNRKVGDETVEKLFIYKGVKHDKRTED